MRICDACKTTPDIEDCPGCGGDRKKLFRGDNALDEFCVWLFTPAHKGVTAIAHNSRGFDAQFVLEYLHQQGVKAPKIVPKGMFFVYLFQVYIY